MALAVRAQGWEAKVETSGREALLQDYAAGGVTWTSLRGRGIENYREVLTGPGEPGLRPPVAPVAGPNLKARQQSRGAVRKSLGVPRTG